MALVLDRQLLFGDEIACCSDDFEYFSETYLKIVDKQSKIVPLKLKPAQLKIIAEIEKNPWLIILKARQLGSSTVIAAYFFWKSLFTPNERTLVVAHTAVAVSNIFRIYKTFYDNLPKFLQFSMKTSSAHEMVFFHGGTIRVSSATGQNFRGATYNNLHCSESAFWKDMSLTIAGLFQTAAGNSCIILETTANGLNQFHALWNDDNQSFGKLFLSWTDDPDYVLNTIVEVPENIKKYGTQWGLSNKQLYWAAQTLAVKCANSFQIFQQEYAIDAMTCFVSSGSRYFDIVFPNAKFEAGYISYFKKTNVGIYIIGVDTASGSPNGDYSSFSVIDVLDPTQPKIVATYVGYKTPIEFGEFVYEECVKWGALAVVESNSYGLTVVEVLRNKEWTKLYTTQKYDNVTQVWTEKIGFNTNSSTRPLMLSTIQQMINSGALIVNDERLQHQINSFVYDATGRPDHAAGSHDDLIISTALALMGRDQSFVAIYSEHRPVPQSLADIVEIEIRTGRPMSSLVKDGYFVDDAEDDLTFKIPH